ncbi:MAG: tetraacyldisaccharide 4'-kinase [Planctomycetota bacterium]
MRHAVALAAPLSLLYGLGIRARNACYDRIPGAVRRAGIPVISIGNITVGGTGKTPFVIEVVRRLQQLGCRPAILTRGYRAAPGAEADEVREFHAVLPTVPVVVNADRVEGAATARGQHDADCVVLDDGFQHRRIARDLDVVLIDALAPWGGGPARLGPFAIHDPSAGGRLLPAGRLREPLNSLRRAHAFVITRANQAEPAAVAHIAAELNRRAPGRPVFTAVVEPDGVVHADGRRAPPDELSGLRMLGVCGLGNPATFERLLLAVRPGVVTHVFPDHHRYSPADVTRIIEHAHRLDAALVVTTRKDWVKLAPLWTGPPPLARLDVRISLSAAQTDFTGLLRRALEERP